MRGGSVLNKWAKAVSDARQGTIEGGGGDRAGLSHQSQSGGGSEVTLAPHLVQNTLIGERRGWSVMSAVGGQTRRLLINIDPETRGLMRAHQRVRARVGARV